MTATSTDRSTNDGPSAEEEAGRRHRARRATASWKRTTRAEGQEDSDLPKDEAGRRKIKRQYETLLGIRIEKLKGRILNRERINKTIEGVYFICIECKKVCHNMDDGLVEDPEQRPEPVWRLRQGEGQGRQGQARRRVSAALPIWPRRDLTSLPVARTVTGPVRSHGHRRALPLLISGAQRRLEIVRQPTANDDAPPVGRMREARAAPHAAAGAVGRRRRRVAVEGIAEHGMADRRQVDADLVADAGRNPDRQQRRRRRSRRSGR